MSGHDDHGEAVLSLTEERPGGERVFQSWTICGCMLPGLRARLGAPEVESVATLEAVEQIARTVLDQPGNVMYGGGPA